MGTVQRSQLPTHTIPRQPHPGRMHQIGKGKGRPPLFVEEAHVRKSVSVGGRGNLGDRHDAIRGVSGRSSSEFEEEHG